LTRTNFPVLNGHNRARNRVATKFIIVLLSET